MTNETTARRSGPRRRLVTLLMGLLVALAVLPATVVASAGIAAATPDEAYALTVTFKTGNKSMATQSFSTGASKALMSEELMTNKPVSSTYGWSFVGWSKTANSLTIDYEDGDIASFSTDTALYAVYKRYITLYFYQTTSGSNPVSSAGTEVREQYYYNSSTTAASARSIALPAMVAITAYGWLPSGWYLNSEGKALSAPNETVHNAYNNRTYTPPINQGPYLNGVYTRSVALTYNGNGYTGGSTPDTTGTQIYTIPARATNNVSLTLAQNGFTRTNYTFKTWGTSSTAVTGSSPGTIVTYDTNPSSSVKKTYYAIWTASSADTYTVTLNANGGSGGTASVKATYGAAMPSATMPTRTGYTFQGYYDTSATTGGTQYYTAAGASARTWNKTSNTTLYARWKANTYTVKLSANGGSGGTTSVSATYGSAMPTNGVLMPTRAGFRFAGFYDTSAISGGTQYYTAAGASARTWNKTADTTLYARWTAIATYTVTFKNISGTTMGTQTFTQGTAQALTEEADLSNKSVSSSYGWKFKGWQKTLQNNSYAIDYTDGQSITVTADMTLRPVYERTLSFKYYNSSTATSTTSATRTQAYYNHTIDGSSNAATSSTLDSVTLPALYTNTSYGWAPRGWLASTSSALISTSTTLTSSSTGASTYKPSATTGPYFFAQYSRTISLAYNGNGSTSGSTSNSTETQYITASVTAMNAILTTQKNGFSKTGHTFKAWGTSSTSTSGTSAEASYDWPNNSWSSAASKTLYAIWTANTYTVTLNKNNGSGGTSSVTATYGAAMPSATMPTRTGFTFAGYYDTSAATGGTQYYTAAGASARTWNKTAATTLYARWTSNTYTVTFTSFAGGEMGKQTFTQGTAQALTKEANLSNKPVSSTYGWVFKGWSKELRTDTYAIDYTDGQSITVTSDMTLRPVYERTLTFKYYASSTATSTTSATRTQEYYNCSSSTGFAISTVYTSVTLPDMTKNFPATGWQAEGWYASTSSSISTSTSTINNKSTGAVSYTPPITTGPYFYGVYSRTATLSYNANGGSGSTSDTTGTQYFTAGATAAKALSLTTQANGFTRTGYTFKAWGTATTSTSGTSAGAAYTFPNTSWSSAASKTLYAIWTGKTYTVSFDANGGSGGQSANVTATYGSAMPAISTTAPTKTGYTFGGWYDTSSSTGGNQYYTAAGASARTWNKTANTTLYARWTANTYAVTLNANGGSGGTASVTATYGAAMPSATMPTRTGYTFQGYYDTNAATGGNQYYTAAGASARTWNKTSTATLYARWTAKTYTVSFDANGGSGGQSADVTATYGSAMPSISTTAPTRTGYTFGGWYDTSSATGGTQYYTAAGASARTWNKTANTTLYARWTAKTYTVSFDANGGSGGQSASVTATYGSAMPAITTTKPTKTGYTFGGWYDTSASTGGKQYYTAAGASARSWDKTANTTLYARWTGNTYTVTLNANGGSGGTASVTATYGSAMPSATMPTRTGYTFAGYYDTNAATGGNQYYTAAGASARTWNKTSTATLYARWTANTYTVTLNKNSGSGGTSSVEATYGSAMPSATMPTRTGYTFQGYYDTNAATGGNQYYTAAGASARTWNKASDTTLYARWTANTYTVSFNANGGSGGQSADVEATYGSAMPAISTTAPTKTGYTFGGWYDTSSATGGTQYYTAAGASARTWNKASDTTLYARWTAKTYTVSFDANGGSGGQSASVTATYGSAMPAISTTKPTKTGYTFGGWYDTNAATGGKQYYTAAGASARSWDKTANTTLYARWTASKYTVTLNANGGTGGTASVEATYNAAMPSATMPTRTGYTFGGYYDTSSATGGTQYYTAAGASARSWNKTSDTTLYARWTANTYTVSFDANGGSGGQSADVTATYGSDMPAISTTKPTRTGYTFKGWYDATSGGTQYYTAACASARTWNKTANTTLYAQWTAKTYTVSFDANGGTGGQSADVTATYGSAMPSITTTKPTKTGYTFGGWYDTNAATGGKQYYTAAGASARSWDKTANTTLYARWTASTYTVTLNANGGSGGTASVTATYGSAMPTSGVTMPTRSGYTFAGYYDTSAASGGTQYYTAAGASARTWDKTTATTLYARWTEDFVRISYASSDTAMGTVSPASESVKATTGTAAGSTATPKAGYKFTKWTDASGAQVGTAAKYVPSKNSSGLYVPATYTANFVPRDDTLYTVNHFQMNTSGAYPSEPYETNSIYTGTTGATLTLANLKKSYTGFTYKEGRVDGKVVTTTTILADGSRVIDLYYERDKYSVTLAKGTGVSAVSGAGSYYHGATVKIDATVSAGYAWSKWTQTSGGAQVSTTKAYSFTMPTSNVSYTANATENTVKISYASSDAAMGTVSPASEDVKAATGAAAGSTATPKAGYKFTKWTDASGTQVGTAAKYVPSKTGGVYVAATYTAVFEPESDTAYTVRHFQMDASGAYPSAATETEPKTGTTGATLTLANLKKTYTGFTYKEGKVGGTTVTTTTILADGSRVIDLYYERDKYSVTLAEGTGVSAVSGAGSYYHGATVKIDATVSAGYAWSKWTQTSGGDTVSATKAYSFTMPTSNVSYTANATENTVKISYASSDAAMGTVSPASEDVKASTGTAAGSTATPKAGYKFTKWTDASGAQVGTDAKYVPSKTGGVYVAATYTANFEPNTYTVTLNANGGEGGTASVTATYGSAMPTSGVTMPTRSGWKFAGYYDTSAATGGTQYYTAAGASARSWDKAEAATLYARWTSNTYTVTLDANDGSGDKASVEAAYGSAMPTPIELPARTGHTFQGYWDTSASTGGTQYYTAAGASARSWDKASDATLYARWTANTYEVSFDANGGEGGQASDVTATYGSAMPAISATAPTRAGYAFGGWYDTSAATGGTQYYTAAGASARSWDKTSDTTLYARWTAVTYDISYDLAGGEASAANPATYTVETESFTLANPTRAGHAFAGWTGTGLTAPTMSVTVAKGSTGDRSYTATWAANAYTFTLGSAAGADTAGSTASGPKAFGEEITLEAAAEPGYTWAGWVSSDAGLQPDIPEASATFEMPAGDLTMTPSVTANTYEVSFDANGGEGGQASDVEATYGSAMPTPIDLPTNTGWKFAGYWDTSEDTGGTQYYTAEGASARAWDKTEGATLYARWATGDEYSYDIVYESSLGARLGTDTVAYAFGTTNTIVPKAFDGYTAPESQTITWDVAADSGKTITFIYTPNVYEVHLNLDGGDYYDESANVTIPDEVTMEYTYSVGMELPDSYLVTKAESLRYLYVFDGWYDAEGVRVDAITATDIGDKELTARWLEEPQTFYVTLETEGGVVNSGNISSYVYGVGATLPTDVTRTGYDFMGWYNLSGVKVTEITANDIGDKAYYARWQSHTYSITLDPMGGTILSGSVKSYTYGVGAILPVNMHKLGHSFAGWYTEKTGGQAVSAVSATDIGDKTYYARWTPKTYAVTLMTQGGTVNSGNLTSYIHGVGATLPTDVTRAEDEGSSYEFDGWYTTATSGTLTTEIPADSTGDRIFYAHWNATPKTFKVTLDTAGGRIVSGNVTEYTYGEGALLPSNVKKTDHSFAGWFDDESGKEVTWIPVTSTGDRSFTAKWVDERTHIVTLPEGEGFTASPTEGYASPVKHGSGFEFTVKVDEGWTLGEVTGNGQTLAPASADGRVTTFRIESVTEDVEILVEVSREPEPVEVTAEAKLVAPVEDGELAEFTVELSGLADGVSATAWRWQYSLDGAEPWYDSGRASAKSEVFDVPANEANKTRLFRCVVKLSDGATVVSEPAKIELVAQGGPEPEPVEVTAKAKQVAPVEDGELAEFTVELSGLGAGVSATAWRWQYSLDGAEPWYDSGRASAKSEVFDVPANEANKTRLFRCVVKLSDGTAVISEPAKIEIAGQNGDKPGDGSDQPADGPSDESTPVEVTAEAKQVAPVEDGELAEFTVELSGLADGVSATAWRWQYSLDGAEPWYDSGRASAKSEVFDVPANEANKTRLFRCVVKLSDGATVVSEPAKIELVAQGGSEPEQGEGEGGSGSGDPSGEGGSGSDDAVVEPEPGKGDDVDEPVVEPEPGEGDDADEPADDPVIEPEPEPEPSKPVANPVAKATTSEVALGANATFRVTVDGLVSGLTASSWKWYFSDDGRTWYASTGSGAKTAELTVAARENRMFKCEVTLSDGTVVTSSSIGCKIADAG